MKRDDYISWNEYFMGIAELSAKRSKDPKTQVGACIVDLDSKHVLSIGYNGLPFGFSDDDFEWQKSKEFLDNKHTYIVHAEANAILNANQNLEKSIAYVTMFPCNECAKLMVQTGIKEIIFDDDKFLHKEQGQAALEIFKKADIKVFQYKKEEDNHEIT